jgi:hypothetical protein
MGAFVRATKPGTPVARKRRVPLAEAVTKADACCAPGCCD